MPFGAGWGLGLRSVAGHLGVALVFMWAGALRRAFSRYFSGLLVTIGGVFILVGGLGAGLLFCRVEAIF